jgi:nucleoside-diphosphate-sugar epimerase
MNILIAGASGFTGHRLAEFLLAEHAIELEIFYIIHAGLI